MKLTFSLFGFLLLLSLPLFVYSQSGYTWKNVAIGGGGFVSGIVYSHSQKDLCYARTDVGGAYRWNAATSSWIPLLDGLARFQNNYMGVLSIATDYQDPTRVYLATGEYTQSWAGTAATFASSNQGQTWNRTDLTFKLGGNEDGRGDGERLQVDPNLNSILFLGTNMDGLWKSTNYAASWSRVTTFNETSILFVIFDQRSGSKGTATKTFFVGVNRNSATLYRTVDGGSTFTLVSGLPSGLFALRAAMDGQGLMYVTFCDAIGPNGVNKGVVRKLNLTSLAWTDITPPTGQGGFAGISVDAQKPNTIMVSTLDRWWPQDEIFRSLDGGSTWTGVTNRSNWDRSYGPYTYSINIHWTNDIEIDPFNSSKVAFVTGYGIWQATNINNIDSGTTNVTWIFQDKGLEETVPLGLISPPSGPYLWSVVGDVDGFRHDNLDAYPSDRYQPAVGTNTGIDFAWNNPNIMARTFNTGTYGCYTTNGGANWTNFVTFNGGSGGGDIAVSADGATFVWNPTNGPHSYSTDHGVTWHAISGTLQQGLRVWADRVNSNKFYAYDSVKGVVYASTDKGVSWSTVYSGLPPCADWDTIDSGLTVIPGFEGNLWVATSTALYHSNNSGAAFTQVTSVQEAYQVSSGKAASGKTYPSIFVHGKINNVVGLFRSDDQGSTWVRVNSDNQELGGMNIVLGDPRVFGRVYITAGGGNGRGILYGQPSSLD